ncbi:uncharacterized protein LOC119378860 [Rhipicephalus sanguineus]|uniref:uncharacterized protein LOC119378860 n=1 Tax=Rhipicephalus sanguineus TaxID=34632 RepID=UPI0020C1ECE6|nr:uncharacterized protein LOC119378860 [Rhipicephalus sanguineus]
MFPASEYFRSLSAAHQQRYSEKLLIYGVQCPDPYGIPSNEWVHDAEAKRLCPPVKMTNVVIYLLFSPSQFTPESVENYKSLQAYNYFESGLVRKCRIWKTNTNKICIVRAEVMPSQTASANGHDVWLCIDKLSGQVLAGHCQCKAGLGEVCSHVAATLFALESAARSQTDLSCTSRPCAWRKATSKKATMAALDELNLSRPGKKARRLAPEPKNTSQPFNPNDQEIFEKLRRAGASAVVLRSIPKVDPEDTDSASEDEEMYTFLR